MVGKKWIVILCVIALICVSAFALVSCAKNNSYADVTTLRAEMFNDYYIGTKTIDGSGENNQFDLSNVYKESSFSLATETSCATLNGNVLTINQDGEFKLNVVTKGKTTVKNIFVKNAVNVFDFSQLEKAVEIDKKSAVVHSEITFPKSTKTQNGSIEVSANSAIYGNANIFNVENVVKPTTKKGWGADAIYAGGENILLQDMHILGMDLRKLTAEEKKNFNMGNLERFGSLVAFRSDDFHGNKIGGTMKNVVGENGHSLISMTGSTVNIEGCIFRNAADSLVSVQTKNNGGTKLTMKNNVLINAVVAGIVCWGTEATDAFLDLNIEGFLDIYNWKDSKTTQIMPSSESFASVANSAVATELSKDKYDKYMFKSSNQKYLHLGMIVISTDKLKSNRAKVNGVVLVDSVNEDSSTAIPKSNGFVLRKFPVAGFEAILQTACIVGFGNNEESKNISVTPSTQFNESKIYEELRNGRK